jgi:hypothetical protein
MGLHAIIYGTFHWENDQKHSETNKKKPLDLGFSVPRFSDMAPCAKHEKPLWIASSSMQR